MGVIAAIVPWNYPFHNVLNPLSAAIFAGNSIVIKVGGVAWACTPRASSGGERSSSLGAGCGPWLPCIWCAHAGLKHDCTACSLSFTNGPSALNPHPSNVSCRARRCLSLPPGP